METFEYQLLTIAEPDPYPFYRWLRDNDPVHYSRSTDLWILSRYEDVSNAFRNWKTWSSQRRGNLINDMPDRVGKTLGTTDPPRHTFARGLVNKAFTPRTVEELKPRVRALARDLSSRAKGEGTIEFVAEISAPFNAAILGAMFGVPEADFIRLRHWLDDFFLREKAQEGQEAPQDIAMRYLRSYLNELADDRAKRRQDDLMSAMIEAEEDGERLDRDQIVVTTMTFLVAGFESTNNLFTNLTNALALHPHIYHKIKTNPALIPSFVEEGMRWDAAAQGFVRTPTKDISLHGKVIPEGAQVVLHIGSANRDERQFENPDTFDIYRDTKRHLGMGQGIHFCVGAPLARDMAYTLFEELIGVSNGWQIDLNQAQRVTTPNFRGFAKLPLTIR